MQSRTWRLSSYSTHEFGDVQWSKAEVDGVHNHAQFVQAGWKGRFWAWSETGGVINGKSDDDEHELAWVKQES